MEDRSLIDLDKQNVPDGKIVTKPLSRKRTSNF